MTQILLTACAFANSSTGRRLAQAAELPGAAHDESYFAEHI